MSKKGIFYVLFFAALVVGFYLAMKEKMGAPDKTISIVQPFSFVDQDGKVFTDKDVQGKVYVAEYFFTTCPGICPKMNKNMKVVYDKFKDEKDFLILSHTSLPEIDSSAKLKEYAEKMKVDTHKWVFLTGRKDSLYNMARTSYTIDDPANYVNNIADDFLHTQFWALVNKKGEVKHVYDGLKESEINAMMKQIKRMLKQ